MSNRLFSKFRQALGSYSTAGLLAPVDLAVDTIKIAAVSASYAPVSGTDQYFTAISAAVVGTPQILTYGSSVAGIYKSTNNPSFAIPASAVVTYLVVYKDTGTAATSPLLALIDTASGLPFTAASSTTTLDVTMDLANGWFTI